MLQKRILILDFGSQYTQLIARRIRYLNVYCEVKPYNIKLEVSDLESLQGVILSGGPSSVGSDQQLKVTNEIFELNVPVLGICYGMQAMAAHFGGEVETAHNREFGGAEIRARGHSSLLKNINDRVNEKGHGLLDVWMSHGDAVTAIPSGFKVIASNDATPIAGMADEKRDFYGLQFHPEVTHTKQGINILERFVRNICGIGPDWSMPNFVDTIVPKIREWVGTEEVLLGLSGGVDSAVAAALLRKAIGNQLKCVFVDNGMLRLNEAQEVLNLFNLKLGIDVVHADASVQFMEALQGITDPEEKRRIIGREFVEVFQTKAKQFKNVKWLAQGTIYPDVIESAGGDNKNAAKIKSHHNVGGLPDSLNLKLIEPLRDLFKDEVRELGITLGLPEQVVSRHPFPGPGLGVRILGEISTEYVKILQLADDIFINELRQSGWYERVAQAFVVFLPINSVGVMGDGRTYENVVSLRAVTTNDFMTANWAELPYELMGKVSNRIINEVKGVNRVVYDISSKPPATIEWE